MIPRSRTPALTLVTTLTLTSCTQPESGAHLSIDPPGATRLSAEIAATAAQTTITVAHRGDSGTAPENTIPAFAAAVRTGAEIVELDFHQTKDRVLVCLHDKTLDRTTDVSRTKAKVADYTLAELQELDAGAWKAPEHAGTRIPTLESALGEIQKGAITMIEHKAGDAAVLVELLRRLHLVDDVIVQSFDWRFLEDVVRLEPRLSLAALGGTKSRPHVDAATLAGIERTRPFMVHWSYRRLRQEDVVALHRNGYLVCVYTVDEPADFDRAIEMGVDAITTNQPARLRAHVAERRAAAGR